MRLGAVFPQIEIGADPGGVRAWVEAVEAMGFDHILIYDHVLGASTANRPDWTGAYTADNMFHEVMVVLGYMAAITERVELVPNVIILPQRQTALVAKQAAEIDVLSRGRLRLGIGVGWNAVEYEALGERFSNRGARVDEQIEVLRRLWTEPVVTYEGRWHRITEAGINPLPVQRPIPLWIGGTADAAIQRAGRLGDGWFPQRPPNEAMRDALSRLRTYAREAGRDPDEIGVEARLSLSVVPESDWVDFARTWRNLGATHLGINTMSVGLQTPDDHIAALRRVKAAL